MRHDGLAPRRPRPPTYGPQVIAALLFCWAVLGAPTGKRLKPVMADLVPRLRRFGELQVTDEVALALLAMAASTMDRRLAPARASMSLRGRSHTKPGSLLKDSVPIRTWADWDDAVPGFVEIDLVGHEGGNAMGEHAYILTVTDIATGWTENRSVRNKARKWVVAALAIRAADAISAHVAKAFSWNAGTRERQQEQPPLQLWTATGAQPGSSPASRARAAAVSRSSARIMRRMRCISCLTVDSEYPRSAPMRALDSPASASRSTCAWRSVRRSGWSR